MIFSVSLWRNEMFLNAQGHALAQGARAESTPMSIGPVQLLLGFKHAQHLFKAMH